MPIVIRCPSCERSLRVPDNLLGRNVKCPTCSTTFTAEDPASAPPPPPAEEEAPPERPSRRRAAEEPEEERPSRRGRGRPATDDEEDEDEERPRRRRRRRRGWRGEEAAAAVNGPAIALLIVGILGIVMGILNIIVALAGMAGGPQGGNFGGQPGGDEAHMAGQIVGAFVSLIWAGVVTGGAVQMKRLQGFGFAMTAAIVAMVPCNPCCLLGLPFGIWAVVVLNRQEVKDAFS